MTDDSKKLTGKKNQGKGQYNCIMYTIKEKPERFTFTWSWPHITSIYISLHGTLGSRVA